MKNIVACVDFSETTPAVMEAAISLAAALRTKLYVLHVVTVTAPTVLIDNADVMAMCEAEKLREAREALDELCNPLRSQGLDVSPVLVPNAWSGEESILREAHRLGSDLMVLGSHGHGRLYTMLLGSTATGVVRRARCAVVVVPSRKLEDAALRAETIPAKDAAGPG